MKALRACVFFILAAVLLGGCAPAGQERSVTIPAMDTVMELTAYGENARQALSDASALIAELEGLLSVTKEGSEIYAANHSGGAAVPLSQPTAELLEQALALCGGTGGALDVTIYPVVRAWGFTTGEYRVPGGRELTGLLEKVDYTRVGLENGSLTLPDGMELDLGAVAKGYTGDRIAALFKSRGISSAKLSLGGNIQVLGRKPDGSLWRVAVRDPAGEGYAFVLEAEDCAVVTSGGYERYFEQDGTRYWHIIDPADGCPARSGLASVTIVSPSGLLADGLSTALFVMGRDRAVEFWRGREDFDFVLLEDDGTVVLSEGLEDRFSLYGDWEGHELEVVRR